MGSYSGISIGSFLILLIGTAAIITSIASHHWTILDKTVPGLGGVIFERGLIQQCKTGTVALAGSATQCTMRYKDLLNQFRDKMETIGENGGEIDGIFGTQDLRAWEFIILVLMSASAVFGVLALLVGPCCCHRCGCCLGTYVLMAALCSTAGVLFYVYNEEKGQTIEFGEVSLDVNVSTYGWSFYAACLGAACQAIASFLFCIGGRSRSNEYTQQI
jgi:hypothetical protein